MQENKFIRIFQICFVIILIVIVAFFVKENFLKEDEESLNTIIVLNYGDYLDYDILDEFEEETGIKVILEEYETPEAMYTKYKTKTINYDLICSADYMIEKLLSEDELLKIDFSNIENIKNIDEKYYLTNKEYTVPYFLGTIGILYNTEKIDKEETYSWNILWNENYKNKIIMPNSVRDALIPALKLNGFDLNTTSKEELDKAFNILKEQKNLNYAYLQDDAMYEMIMENADLALIYSGEAAAAISENENLDYTVPLEGSNLWIDSWFIPKTCKNKEAVEKFLNFLCREDIAYKNWDEVYYTTPNKLVFEILNDEDKEDETMFPDEEILNRCQMMNMLSSEDNKKLNTYWKELKVY